ncbi:MAG: ATP-binding protein [Leptospirales bacterium]|nr:ATP-binding protein [Leptospirales bacterium]
MKKLWHDAIRVAKSRENLLQLSFVSAAFIIMTVTSNFFVRNILWNQLVENSERSLFGTESYIRAAFAEADISLLNTYHTIRDRINLGASQKDLLKYLQSVTAWMREREGALRLYGVYGYIRGEFLNGLSEHLDPDYIPQQRSWYQTAVRNIGSISYTVPYLDVHTGEMIVSAVTTIDDAQGKIIGVLAIDLNVDWLNEYVKTLSLSKGGYGVILNQNMTIVAHPNKEFKDSQFYELGTQYDKISNMLRKNETVFAESVTDYNGEAMLAFFRPLFNGWYVGLITPQWTFYRSMYTALLVLSLLGIVLSVFLSLLLLRLEIARLHSDEENESKSSFLARMSHEIRTPMNAIIGMGELALQADTLPKAAEYIKGIKQAGYNLLALINDILDFSKIDAGNLEILSFPYEFASLLNDVINVARVRISEKPILFAVNVDASIPNQLLGDEARIRQVLLNLLSNAAKYTKEGFITLTVNASYDETEDGARGVTLSFEIADTGIGIKKEDLTGLFGNFVRLDFEKNYSVEGTGLGLSITRSLCLAMGGDITVTSTYGQGSVFTAVISQICGSDVPLASVENPSSKETLVYDERELYAESILFNLKNLKVPATAAADAGDFLSKLESNAFPFAFVSSRVCDEAVALVKRKKLATQLAILIDLEEFLSIEEDIPTIMMPVYAVAIAQILNDKKTEKRLTKAAANFIAPSAKLLIVDDIQTNILVAEGLLAPYRTELHACGNGREALEMVKKNNYDIVFMDHMMPGMDGVEATAAIRAMDGDYFKEVPIVALTANAISGMKEMFLSKGFSDYLSKPIEIAKLNGIMDKWIPQGKRESIDISKIKTDARNSGDEKALLTIHGVDVNKGITMTGGTFEGYLQVLALFRRDAEERLALLKELPDKEKLPFFTSQVHALKGASGALGAADVSAKAAELETAGKAGDMDIITRLLPEFTRNLAELIEGIRSALRDSAAEMSQAGAEIESSRLIQSLNELSEALKAREIETIDRILSELGRQLPDSKTKRLLEQVSDEVLMTEFDKALGIIEELMKHGAKAGKQNRNGQ